MDNHDRGTTSTAPGPPSLTTTAPRPQPSTRTAPAPPAPARREGGRRPRVPVWTPWPAAPVLLAVGYALLPAATNLRSQYQASAVVLVASAALAWLLTRRSALAHHAAGALTASVLPALTMISLHGTAYFLSGPYGDQSFRLEYAMRFASHLTSLTDYTYDVPAFYSPGWFWLVGAGAAATGEPAWHVYKWVAIGSLFVAVALAFWLWRRTCSPRLAALLVATTCFALPAGSGAWLGNETLYFSGAYEPYGWLVALPLPALLTWLARARGAFSWRRGLLLGVAFGAAAYLYLLYALAAFVGVLVVVLWRGRTRPRLLETLVAVVAAAVLVSPWLGRFLVAWLRAGRPKALATTYVIPDSYVHLLTAAATPGLALALVGAVGMLVLTRARDRRLVGAQATVGAVLVLGVVQLVAGQAAAGVLFHRLLLVLGVGLLAGGTLVLVAVGPALAGRLRAAHPLLATRRLAAAGLALAALLSLTAQASDWMSMTNNLRKLAHDVPLPDGTLPPLASPSTRTTLGGQASADSLAQAVREVAATAGRPATDPVLTDDELLLATSDLFGYQQWWSLYANPLGEYADREAFLRGLNGRSAQDVVQALRRQPGAPTLFVLRHGAAGPTFSSSAWDPGAATSTSWTVTLPSGLFDGPDFVTRRVGDWTVAALRRG